ncbi:MAG: hypothetical protein ACXWQO_07325, partial [Bdellovibrionota bacterium]
MGAVLVLIAIITFFQAAKKSGHVSIAGPRIEDFALLDHSGDLFELYRGAKKSGAKALVLVVTGIGCPIAEKSLPRVQALADAYKTQKIP